MYKLTSCSSATYIKIPLLKGFAIVEESGMQPIVNYFPSVSIFGTEGKLLGRIPPDKVYLLYEEISKISNPFNHGRINTTEFRINIVLSGRKEIWCVGDIIYVLDSENNRTPENSDAVIDILAAKSLAAAINTLA